ncbi:MAG: phosphatase PAP2 family protein [Bacteroidota bacterium]
MWAFGVAYSRVYLGVHFPLDVIAGMGTGTLLSLAIWILLKWQLQSDLSALQ